MRYLSIALLCLLTGCSKEAKPIHLTITGSKYAWHLEEETSGERTKITELRLPAHQMIILTLKSEDLLYTFRIKAWEVNAMAVPELPEELSFRTTSPGIYTMLGDQMCGYSHEALILKVIVE